MNTELQTKAETIVSKAQAHVVSDQESYEIATSTIKAIKGLKKEVESSFDPIIKKAHDSWKESLAQKKKFTDPLDEADAILRRKSADWYAEQERIRREEQRKADEEKARLEREAREKAEAEARAEADRLAAEGKNVAAQIVLETPVKIEPVKVTQVVQPAPASNGVGFRESWDYTIEDVSLIPREFMVIDHAAIGKIVRAMKDKTNIPGVKVTASKVAVVR